MVRIEGESFALILVSLVACGDVRDPLIDDDDEGVEVGLDGDSSDADKLDAMNEGSGTAEGGDGSLLEGGCEKVDLLFVIDNSGSMKDEQVNLVSSFPAFIDEIQVELSSTESYHIGVISTDDYEFNVADCQQEGAMIVATGGDESSDQVCGPFAAGHHYMTEQDDLDQAFACAAQIGVDGDGDERGMQTMQAALSQELNQLGGCNEGFLRDDALLVVVVITDEEDDHEVEICGQSAQPGSAGEPPEWFAGVTAAKGGFEKWVVVLSLIGPPGPDPVACPALDKCESGVIGAEPAHRISEFTGMFTYGFIGRVCEPSYASFFQEAVAVIKTACADFNAIE
jgi:hypothetical protein